MVLISKERILGIELEREGRTVDRASRSGGLRCSRISVKSSCGKLRMLGVMGVDCAALVMGVEKESPVSVAQPWLNQFGSHHCTATDRTQSSP